MRHATKRTAAFPDAIKLLTTDHKEVKALFKAYGQLGTDDGDADEKQRLAFDICTRVTVHAAIEEEFLYPAARNLLAADENLVDEADVEHATAKALVAQIMQLAAAGPLDDVKVKILGEHIDHHAREEEDGMFPRLKRSALDLQALGEAMGLRKDELLAQAAGAG